MNFFLDLFTPETWSSFCATDRTATGFRQRQRRAANERVRPGDLFLCYVIRLSRWCGILEVKSNVYEDDSPIHDDPDPFTIRFEVQPIVILEYEHAIPIKEQGVWNKLSVTREADHAHWSGFFRTSLNRISKDDGDFLVSLLKNQRDYPQAYPLSANDRRELQRKKKVRAANGEVEVEIPEDDRTATEQAPESTPEAHPESTSVRESILVQAKVAEIGAKMNFRIWVPSGDRQKVLENIPTGLHEAFLDVLPLNYEENTLRTIEQIDVLWVRKRSMIRAFEVEHSTAIYSGLLRMADLLALQPNMDIRLNIIAPDDRREKVLREIRRPVFSLLERPLHKQCSFLSYDSIASLSAAEHLEHMNDTIVETYEESAEV